MNTAKNGKLRITNKLRQNRIFRQKPSFLLIERQRAQFFVLFLKKTHLFLKEKRK